MEKPLNPNRTRDHLANERTYLAWMRAAIALIGFGIVIVRLSYDGPTATSGPRGWEVGLMFCIAGLLSVVGTTLNYFGVQNAIENDVYQPSRRRIVACSALIFLLGAGVIWYVLSAAMG
jgi:putative membrane protein